MFRKALLILAVGAMAFTTSTAHATCPYGGGGNRGFNNNFYRGGGYSNFNRGYNYNRGYNNVYRGGGWNNVNRGFAPHHRGGWNNGWGGGFNTVRGVSNFIGVGPLSFGW